MDRDMVLLVESDLTATNTIEVNLQVVENLVYRSHPLASRQRRLFEFRNKGGSEKTDSIKAMMMQS
jgi:hypothetical protein